MAKRMTIGVVGLGKFGFSVGKTMMELGHEVLGIDADAEKVQAAHRIFTQVYQGDASDRHLVEQLQLGDLDHIIVSIGGSIEVSCMVSLYLKEAGAQSIWVKAISDDHEKLLRLIGVNEVVFPEQYAASQLGHRLAMPGLMAYLPFEDGNDEKEVVVRQLEVDEWEGKTLRELDLTNTKQIQVIAVRPAGEEVFSFIPKADRTLHKGDTLMVLGFTDEAESLSG